MALNLMKDHEQQRYVVGDWTAVNLIAWGVIVVLVLALAAAGAALIAVLAS